jgi:putative phage-type endonuclease
MPSLICSTADRDAWLTARRSGVTATDIVTILGLSAYDSPYSLYWRKLGQVPEQPDNPRMALSRYLEEYVWARWTDETRLASRSGDGLYASSARPWQMATPDYVVWSEATPEATPEASLRPVAPIEVKTWAEASHAWDDGMPASVRAQVLWQMDVFDAAIGHVGMLFLPSGEFRSYVIEHNHGDDVDGITAKCSACADLAVMRAAGADFWRRMQDNDPPDPDASAATLAAAKARFTRRKGKRGAVDNELWNPWVGARLEADYWQEIARGHEAKIREQLGEADEIEVDGQLVGRRVIVDASVKAHTRHQDYLKRIGGNGSE